MTSSKVWACVEPKCSEVFEDEGFVFIHFLTSHPVSYIKLKRMGAQALVDNIPGAADTIIVKRLRQSCAENESNQSLVRSQISDEQTTPIRNEQIEQTLHFRTPETCLNRSPFINQSPSLADYQNQLSTQDINSSPCTRRRVVNNLEGQGSLNSSTETSPKVTQIDTIDGHSKDSEKVNFSIRNGSKVVAPPSPFVDSVASNSPRKRPSLPLHEALKNLNRTASPPSRSASKLSRPDVAPTDAENARGQNFGDASFRIPKNPNGMNKSSGRRKRCNSDVTIRTVSPAYTYRSRSRRGGSFESRRSDKRFRSSSTDSRSSRPAKRGRSTSSSSYTSRSSSRIRSRSRGGSRRHRRRRHRRSTSSSAASSPRGGDKMNRRRSGELTPKMPCLICPKKLADRRGAFEHELNAHAKLPRFPCFMCKQFNGSTVYELQDHIETAHPAKKRVHELPCPFCQRMLDLWEPYLEHVNGEYRAWRQRQYAHVADCAGVRCDKCGLEFKDPDLFLDDKIHPHCPEAASTWGKRSVARRGCPHVKTFCKKFPACVLVKCNYAHPTCKFDRRCSETNCPFFHSDGEELCRMCSRKHQTKIL